MRTTTDLSPLRVTSPCLAAWSEMSGDDRVRFCGLCQRHVFNLSALTAAEAQALVERTEGKLCARFHQRRDGTILTADCPVGASQAAHSRLRRLVTCSAVGLVVALAGVFARPSDGSGWRPHYVPMPTGPGITLRDWTNWALEILDLREPTVVMGALEIPVSSFEPPPTPPPCDGNEAP